MTVRLRRVALLVAVALGAAACAQTEPPRPAYSGDISKGNPTAEARGRALRAALEALEQEVRVHLDGEDKPPATVHFEACSFSEDDVYRD